MKNMYLCLSISFLILVIILTISNSKSLINFVEDFNENTVKDCDTINELEQRLINNEDVSDRSFKKDTFSECIPPCPKGTYINKNTGKCEECDVTSYSDEKNLFECKSCPENQLSFEKGATEREQCKDIDAVYSDGDIGKLNNIIKHLREKVNTHRNNYDLYEKVNKGFASVEDRYNYIDKTNNTIKNLKGEIDILLNSIY